MRIDSLIYTDSDTLFFDSVEKFWDNFNEMNSTQMIGIIEEAPNNWFQRNYEKKHSLIGKAGGNSGVLLMNLTKMRAFNWVPKIINIYNECKNKSKDFYWDQGLINIISTNYPGNRKIFEKIYLDSISYQRNRKVESFILSMELQRRLLQIR